MKTSVIRIGNSKGIRIPKTLLKQCHLEGDVELQPGDHKLVIRPLAKHREGWEEAFQRMAQAGDDALRDQKCLPRTEWDKIEWKW